MDKSLQCKDILVTPILQFLETLAPGQWAGWHDLEGDEFCPSVYLGGMPHPLPSKLVLAKMRQLLRMGLVEGCGCGCRGDFQINETGRQFLHDAAYRASTWPTVR